MENDLPPDGIRNLTEVNVIRVCIGNLVVVGIFLQHNHSVFIKIGAEPRFVTEKVLAGDAVYGLIPIFQFNIIVIITFQSLDMITFAGIISLCFDIHDPGTAVVQVFGFFPPSFLFRQCNRFNPWKIIPPATCQTIHVVPFIADNFCPLGIIFRSISPDISFRIFY